MNCKSDKTRQRASKAKRDLGVGLKELLHERFAGFSNKIFESMRFIDPAHWDDEKDFGGKNLTNVHSVFQGNSGCSRI